MTEENVPPPPPPPSDPTTPAPVGTVPYATPGASGYPGPYVGPAPDKDSKTMSLLAHLLGILIGFIGPLVIWLLKKDTMPFVADQAREALNFAITVSIAFFALLLLTILSFGIGALLTVPVMMVIGITALVLCIIAAIKANDGVAYRYPFALRLVK